MGEIFIASLNINGARDNRKRFQLYEVIKQKKMDVVFVQETHSDAINAADWAREFDGVSILSHLSSVSGGVAILFSKNFIPCSYQIDEIIKGRLLKIRAQFEDRFFVFLCVYAPNNALERMVFLDTLCEVLCSCDSTELLFLGGDFNCTEHSLDRNHIEPHMLSRRRLIQLLNCHEIVDVWRYFNGSQRQYTWVHAYDHFLSLARLDRFYTFKHHLSFFRGCSIIPVGFSDHSMVQCVFTLGLIKPKSAYWHFNNNLLCDKNFKVIFKQFWKNVKTTKSSFLSLQQWWNLAKVQVKQLCQQYTYNVTRDITCSMKKLEKELVELQTHDVISDNTTDFNTFQKKKRSLAELLEITTQGALVRSRFQSIELMDAPSKFFFNLEKKNGQKRFIHTLRSESGILLSNPIDIRKRAVEFYKDLYKSELVGFNVDNEFLNNLPQISEEANFELSKVLTLGELENALQKMECGKSPGIDGLPVDFYKAFWQDLGQDLLEVLNECFASGWLPTSCRRAVITLLPKKGDLNDVKNWRPVSLLSSDYKILSKTLANRLSEAIEQVVHPDQTYCIPSRRISDNISFIRDIMTIGNDLNLDFGLVSIDQEKAFDRIEHDYLWNVLAAFGFNSKFIAMIKVLYSDVESILKVNGDLCAPFKVYRGIRQGCALSGMLYSLAIEPFLNKLRNDLCGLRFPNCTNVFKLSAYADDVVVLVSGQRDIDVLLKTLRDFKLISSTNVNWTKSEAILVGKWSDGEPSLPDGLTWTKDGFKYLGVFLGNDTIVQKNFEGVIEKVKGRLERWKFLLPKISYKGRILIINNLIASSLWHQLICVDPPADFLAKIQSILIDFFWDKLHWVPKAVLYLPKEEGGHGLMDLQSRLAAFRLQFVQRLLSGSMESNWIAAAFAILRSFKQMNLDKPLFWLKLHKSDLTTLPVFYRNLFKVWSLFKVQRLSNATSLYWLFQEPLVYGSRLDITNNGHFPALDKILLNSGVITLGHLIHLSGTDFGNVDLVAKHLGIKSTRLMAKLLEKWKSVLNSEEHELLENYSRGLAHSICEDPFPIMWLLPDLDECKGPFLNVETLLFLGDVSASGRTLYKNCVKSLNRKFLDGKTDTPWRTILHLKEDTKPEWRILYKSPLTKKVGDLQWRILHGAIAVNAFISVLNSDITHGCPFCSQRETVFHAFMHCFRLTPLFNVLQNLFLSFEESFSLETFICGFKYTRRHRFRCQLLNFVLGQAKMAIYDTRKKKIEQDTNCVLDIVFFNLIKSRILVDFHYYKAMNDLVSFEMIWCVKGALCEVLDETLCFAPILL